MRQSKSSCLHPRSHGDGTSPSLALETARTRLCTGPCDPRHKLPHRQVSISAHLILSAEHSAGPQALDGLSKNARQAFGLLHVEGIPLSQGQVRE